eukprot:260517-Pleurochrysis_carterae.AAC.3
MVQVAPDSSVRSGCEESVERVFVVRNELRMQRALTMQAPRARAPVDPISLHARVHVQLCAAACVRWLKAYV